MTSAASSPQEAGAPAISDELVNAYEASARECWLHSGRHSLRGVPHPSECCTRAGLAAALASREAEVRRLRESYELKLADFARETLRTSAALAACERSAVPMTVVGEAGLGYEAAQDDIRRAIEQAAS